MVEGKMRAIPTFREGPPQRLGQEPPSTREHLVTPRNGGPATGEFHLMLLEFINGDHLKNIAKNEVFRTRFLLGQTGPVGPQCRVLWFPCAVHAFRFTGRPNHGRTFNKGPQQRTERRYVPYNVYIKITLIYIYIV